MKYSFTKIKSDHDRMRDDAALMDSCSEIVVGKPVFLYGPPRDISIGTRQINTSPVVEIERISDVEVEILTESGSRYSIKEIKDEE